MKTQDKLRKKRSSASADPPPIVVKQGSISVKIYVGKNRIYRTNPETGERELQSEHPQYTLAYYDGSERVRRKFTSEYKAREEAENALIKLANGENEALRLKGADRADYVRAMQKLQELSEDPNLVVAVEDYTSARRRLPSDVSLNECVNSYLRRHPAGLPPVTVSEVIDELVEVKRNAGKSDVYIKDLESRLGKFGDAMNIRISSVTGKQIEDYIRGLGKAPRTQNNIRRLIGTLFKFAIRRGYLPKDHDEMAGVEKADDSGGEIEVFTPDELNQLFDAARPEMIPYLAIAAFAGLRASEIQRLDWSEIKLPRKIIEVKAAKAKTASRRIVPVTDNLVAWLTPYAQPFGPVMPFENASKQLTEILAKDAKLRWKRNGLRHGFISYRLAIIKDMARVALEAGNSPQMIIKHYRELVTEEEAKKWFGKMPPEEADNKTATPRNADQA